MTDLAALTARRKRLLATGYTPLPANGKAVHLAAWSSRSPPRLASKRGRAGAPATPTLGCSRATRRASTSMWTPTWPPSCTASSSP
jgi:hypothetical protein